MLEYTRGELSEKDLEDRIIKHPQLIESGLQYLEHQRHTSSGRLDILFVDNNGSLVVAELKVIKMHICYFKLWIILILLQKKLRASQDYIQNIK